MKTILFACVLLLSGCVSTTANVTQQPALYSDTMDIIRDAAESAPLGVEGSYTLKIKASGNQGKQIFLNTELDYRDQRNVTIALHPRVVSLLMAKYGESPENYFVDKSITVTGQAQRIKIGFFNEQRKPTGKYYYQTHIRIVNADQIKVISGEI
ncbi:hypothetical protein [Alteromonas facilis]|uniref:hypothetical protein n=1 Tax=Alteromonas facilis TaxID=2048004 RepID=UPI000C28F696|nr:hypothetical protein [Alteromonas facilis]